MSTLIPHSNGKLDADLRQMAWKVQYAREFVRGPHPKAELIGVYREGPAGVWIVRFYCDPDRHEKVEVVMGGSMFITKVDEDA